ncbi:MAG: cytochrome c3 family protein [Desulfobulbales bacterium]|nr:cytochrome c3 family protein [Desulfobulbales bacterium]
MSSHLRFFTLLFSALLVSPLLWHSYAIGSDQPEPPGERRASETPRHYETPKFFVPPPPFSEGIFPCSDCHADMEVNPERRQLEDEHVEISEIFNHASEQRWCLDCHNHDNRDVLRLANGDLVSFEESYNLCGQCHGTIFRDWKAGIHGKRTGEWNGKKQYRLCVHCHNPHSPRFKPLKPLPPPHNPLEVKYKKLSEDEIPRNPLGNMQ